LLQRIDSETLAELLGLLAAGKIKPVMAERIPLAEAARAHERLEHRLFDSRHQARKRVGEEQQFYSNWHILAERNWATMQNDVGAWETGRTVRKETRN
jgi:Zinc-binding dehydrogenase